MPEYLNHEFGFDEVRWQTMRKTSYDSLPSFEGVPEKVLLPIGTILFRLAYLPTANNFDGAWWMPKDAFDQLKNTVNAAPHGSGRMLRNYVAEGLALPAAGFQLCVIEIELTRPVYAWRGPAAGLFDRPGGASQIYLPNLAERGDPRTSLHAKAVRTYWLKF
jgi:hypothetical protein